MCINENDKVHAFTLLSPIFLFFFFFSFKQISLLYFFPVSHSMACHCLFAFSISYVRKLKHLKYSNLSKMYVCASVMLLVPEIRKIFFLSLHELTVLYCCGLCVCVRGNESFFIFFSLPQSEKKGCERTKKEIDPKRIYCIIFLYICEQRLPLLLMQMTKKLGSSLPSLLKRKFKFDKL